QIRETNDCAGDVSRLCVHWAIDRGRQKDARFILGGAGPVSFFVQIMRVVAREGSAKPAAVSYVIEQVKNRWKGLTPEAKNDFHAADGMRVLISLLKQVNFKAQDWPNAEASLTFLLQEFKEVPGFPRALLVLLQKEGWRFSEVQQLPHSFLFEVVLDPLMDDIRKSNVKENGERKAIAAIHDFVDSTDPTPLEERLLATARALEQLEKTRRDLRDVQVKPTLDFLSELKETTVGEAKRILDAEQAKIDAIFRAKAPGKWQDLRKTESRLIKEATEMIEEKEKSLKRSAAEAEARKQKRQRNQQLDEAKKLSDKLAKMVKKSTPEKGSTQTWSLLSSSEAAADAVRAWCKAFDDKKAECDKCDAFERPDEATLEPWLREAKEAINDFQAKKLSEQLAKLLKKSNCEKGSKATWSLVRFTEDAAEELKEWCQAFNDKKAAPECSKYAPFERPHEASLEPWLKEAQDAFKDFQEHEGRLVELRRQLGLLNIPDGVIAVLKQGQRLRRLRELAQRPQLLDGIGLPPGIADRLLEGQANFVNLDLKLPNGWFSKRSTRYMVEYYYLNQRTEWFWPEQDADPPARGWPASVAGLQPAPPGSCAYVQDWSDSTKWCFLCNDEATLDHLEDRRHAASRSAWQRLSAKLDHLSEEASKVSAPRNGEELKEDLILQCWMEHTLNSLEEEGVDPRIVQLFVVQCVRPHFPKSLNGGALAAALSSCFSEAAASSRQPEPDVLIHPPVPVPGTDFPMVPGGMLVEIENPEEAQWIQAAKNLTEMDLLRHGLILQESGQLHCVFCETPGRPEVVENEPWAIARHLSKSRSQPGRTHQKYRQHWAPRLK
ncbi:HERC1, partial [Symbiodinium sp. CCMP2456]